MEVARSGHFYEGEDFKMSWGNVSVMRSLSCRAIVARLFEHMKCR